MHRIGIITFHFSENFGAVFQAYALRSWLRRAGYSAEFVDYRPSHIEERGSFRNPLRLRNMKGNAKSAYLFLNSAYNSYSGKTERGVRMEDFRTEFLGVPSDGNALRTVGDVEEAAQAYDTLICGSDQIWSPSDQFGLDRVYFLDFEALGVRKISYAASFGTAVPSDVYHDDIRMLVGRLDAVSVREKTAQEFLARSGNIQAACVADPTFLWDDYSNIIGGSTLPKFPHIFVHTLRSGHGFRAQSNFLRRVFGVEILEGYNPHRRWRTSGEVVSGGPCEWLDALVSSEFVLTNSFHATAFSIISRRPFAAVRLPGAKRRFSARIENLLSSLDLQGRIVDAGDIAALEKLQREEIDWEHVGEKVREMRSASESYLKESLAIIHE